MNDHYSNSFATFDLGLAAALVSAGCPVSHLDKSQPQKVQFVFERKEGIDDAIQLYWANGLQISAFEYFNNLKMLKNRIYSG